MTRAIVVASVTALLLASGFVSCSYDRDTLNGHWKLVPEKSASIDPWSSLVLDIHTEGTHAAIVKRYSAGHPHDQRIDSMTVNTGGSEQTVVVSPGRWLGEVSMGIYYGPQTIRHVVARMNDSRTELHIDCREPVQTAQGTAEVVVKEVFTLGPDGSTVQWSETRSTRRSGPPLNYTFARITE
jgi:hypothetical protein